MYVRSCPSSRPFARSDDAVSSGSTVFAANFAFVIAPASRCSASLTDGPRSAFEEVGAGRLRTGDRLLRSGLARRVNRGSYWYVLADERVSLPPAPVDAERVERGYWRSPSGSPTRTSSPGRRTRSAPGATTG